ncbi:MAG: hypothetical protein LBJ00_01535 [Planctomycetaceae bacterium]|nr:hypothetical protein [Planctomycetaceae bacterium]
MNNHTSDKRQKTKSVQIICNLSWQKISGYTVAGRAIGFALEQPVHVAALACSAIGILKQLQYKS